MITTEEKEKPQLLPQLCTTNLNMLWGGLMAETLARMGLEQAVISPGSRSGPLAVGFGTNSKIEAIPVLDERSAAFFALGLAKRSRKPVALICSSGTAVANYYPAIIEARMSKVPLIVLTADRPAEMRECHSGQTIDQVKIFSDYVNFYQELALPEENADSLRYLRQTMVHAYERAIFPQAGVVHLNIPFKDPLAPVRDAQFQNVFGNLNFKDFFKSVKGESRDNYQFWMDDIEESFTEMLKYENGVIIVGPCQPSAPQEFVNTIQKLSELLGWPILAEGLSPFRNFAERLPYVITRYDLILRNKQVSGVLKPQAVLSIGALPTSKVLRAWLKENYVNTWVLEDSADNVDPLHRSARTLRVSKEALKNYVNKLEPKTRVTSNYLDAWRCLEMQAVREISEALNDEDVDYFFEGKVALELSRHLPKSTPVFVSTSMPVRDVEFFWEANNNECEMYFNRGANGLDGLLSTALGVAHRSKPAVLLIGDLGLLHDSNGFLLKEYFNGSLTIIVINNNGGGVFEHLPIAEFGDFFEKFVATPQSREFEKLAALHEVEYLKPDSWEEFRDLVSELPKDGMRIVEICTDRKGNAATRSSIFEISSNQLKI